MKQFNTLLKVKSFEEIQLIEELSNLNDLIFNIESSIQSYKDKIQSYKDNLDSNANAFEQLSLRAIINALYNELNNAELYLKSVFSKKENILSSLTEVRQEIKSVEKLISKKKERIRVETLNREQEMLDELNTLD